MPSDHKLVSMQSAGAWFALVVAGIGWFYIFGSQAAHGLQVIEAQAANRRRVYLRSINGTCLIALATCLFAGVYSIDPHHRPGLFMGDWLAVMALLLVSVVLAMADLRLTVKLRRPSGGEA
jgi:hypothetical protein